MIHDPLCTASRRKIDPAGLHIPVCKFCRVARCGFASRKSHLGKEGWPPSVASSGRWRNAHYVRHGRMDRPSPSSQEVKHV